MAAQLADVSVVVSAGSRAVPRDGPRVEMTVAVRVALWVASRDALKVVAMAVR